MINKGDQVAGYEVLAAHTQEDHDGRTQGVALGYADWKREYGVWWINGDHAHTGMYTHSDDLAYLEYAKRVIDRLYTYHNKMAPEVSFDVRH